MKKEHGLGEIVVPLPVHSSNFKVNRMLNYIEKHWDITIELEDIASWADLTPQYASFLFSKTMCMTFVQYMNAYKINKGAEMLKNTNYSIKKISDLCGFQNTSYFIRIFRSFCGITPGEYRKNGHDLIDGIEVDSIHEVGIVDRA